MTSGLNCEMDLLMPDEPPPFTLVNPGGTSAAVLVCDHASNRVPRVLNNLCMNAAQLASHIAWDPGAALVAKALSEKLDAALVLSNYSRLVIDCNRPLQSPQSIPEQSAGELIRGNQHLSPIDRAQRIHCLFWPYQDAITQLLQQRASPTILLSIHSFTPDLNGESRPWQIGVAGYRNPSLSRALFSALRLPGELTVGMDQPYSIETDVDYTVPAQVEARGIPSAMIEIRQDEIRDSAQAQRWAERLALAWEAAQSLQALKFETGNESTGKERI